MPQHSKTSLPGLPKCRDQKGSTHLHHVSSLVGPGLRYGARHQVWHHLAWRNHRKHHLRHHSACQLGQANSPQDNPLNALRCPSLPGVCAGLED